MMAQQRQDELENRQEHKLNISWLTKVVDHVKPGCIVYVYELRTINDGSAKARRA